MPQDHRPRSWKEKRDRAIQNRFIGREAQLQAFRSTLATPDDQRDKAIFNLSGQGGIGKTTLLKQFRKITEELKQVAAYVDEGAKSNPVDNVPEALDRLAQDFEAQGYSFEKFQKQYKVYRQKKQELEADPEAPQGFVAGLGKFVTKASLGAAKSIPGSGAVLDFVDTDAFADKTGEFAAFIARKLTNKDEVRLLQEPLEVLTPLFLEDLNRIAEKQTVVLLLDTYEQTGAFWDDWLRALLDCRYGELTPNFLLGIAGREPLNRNDWANLESWIARSELEPFTFEEAQHYLNHRGITNTAVIQEIWRLSSSGLPLLIEMMAQVAPTTVAQILAPCEDAVERFLKWETDPAKRQLAMEAAIPRLLNRDVLGLLEEEATLHDRFEWLKSRSFVVEHPEGWQYHPIVREQMLRYQRKVSQKDWAKLHGNLAAHYDELRQKLGLEEAQKRKDATWRKYTLEWLYHSLCAVPRQQLGMALNGWLAALKDSRAFARTWAEVMANVQDGSDCVEIRHWGEQLRDSLQAYKDKQYDTAIETLSALLKVTQIEAQWRPVALDWRGFLYWKADQYDLSLQDLNEAIHLAPEEAKYWFDRGKTYHWMKQYNKALDDFEKAINLHSDDSDIYTYRSQTYRCLKQYEQAIDDSNQAIQLNEKSDFAWINRGATYQQMKNYEAALASFNRAIELNKNYVLAIAFRGINYRFFRQYEAALTDLNRAIELDPNSDWILAERGETYRLMKDNDAALADFDRAIEINGSYAWAIASRAQTYRTLEQYEAAIADFNRAIKLDPNSAWKLANRGETHRLMENYDAALIDFDRAIELNENYTWAITKRGQTYKALQQYEAAIADFNRAVELEPSAWKLVSRGEIQLALGEYEQALVDLNQSLELKPESNWQRYIRALAYLALNQPDSAKADLSAAIQLAKAIYDQDSTDWRDIFNLALYYLVDDQIAAAEMLYGFASDAPNDWVKMAIRDLQDLLVVFPDNISAQQMLQKLQAMLH